MRDLQEIESIVRSWKPAYKDTTRLDLETCNGALGLCLLMVVDLERAFAQAGVQTARIRVTGTEYPGREHWALIVPTEPPGPDWDGSGTVVDVTARQFDPDAASPWIGDSWDWLDDVCEWLCDGLAVEWRSSHEPGGDGVPFLTDLHSREDIEPGPMRSLR